MTDHAIVIGIDVYPGLNNLKGSLNDAKEFRDWLLNPSGGNIDPVNLDHCILEVEPDTSEVDDAHPTRDELEDLFRPLVKKAAKGKHIGKRLFVFCAGHGFADSQDAKSAALFAANAESTFPLHLAVLYYVNFLQRAWAFDEIIVVLDSCRSTNPMHEIGKPQLPRINPHANSGKVKVFVGYGAIFNSVSREREFDGISRGIFTMAFMDALKNAKPNTRGRVTGSMVKNHVHNVIEKFAGDVDIGPIEIDANEKKDVLFLRREPNGVPVEFELDPAHHGLELVILFGGQELVHRQSITDSRVSIPLEPGLYIAQIEIAQVTVQFEVPVNEKVRL